MPKAFDRCVKKVSKTVKPRSTDQTKREAAFAICTASFKKAHKKFSRS